jgi:hypothetical protein
MAIAPSLWIPPPMHCETVTPFNVASPELQIPADGLEMTDEEVICSTPADWIPPPAMAHPVIDMI